MIFRLFEGFVVGIAKNLCGQLSENGHYYKIVIL